MKSKWTSIFFYSAAAVLMLTAAAKLYSASGTAKILLIPDPLPRLPYRNLMWAISIVEGLIATYLISSGSLWKRAALLFWLSTNFILYHFAVHLLNVKICPCLGRLASKLPWSQERTDQILVGCVLYWFVGSAFILWRLWNQEQQPVLARA